MANLSFTCQLTRDCTLGVERSLFTGCANLIAFYLDFQYFLFENKPWAKWCVMNPVMSRLNQSFSWNAFPSWQIFFVHIATLHGLLHYSVLFLSKLVMLEKLWLPFTAVLCYFELQFCWRPTLKRMPALIHPLTAEITSEENKSFLVDRVGMIIHISLPIPLPHPFVFFCMFWNLVMSSSVWSPFGRYHRICTFRECVLWTCCTKPSETHLWISTIFWPRS